VPLERGPEHLPRLVQPVGADRLDRRVEHQADPGERLDGTVVEEERESSALLLLGDDHLVRELGPLGLAYLCLGEQPRALDRPRGEVGEQRRPRELLTVERARAHEP
jgi:hypothetical protein